MVVILMVILTTLVVIKVAELEQLPRYELHQWTKMALCWNRLIQN